MDEKLNIWLTFLLCKKIGNELAKEAQRVRIGLSWEDDVEGGMEERRR